MSLDTIGTTEPVRLVVDRGPDSDRLTRSVERFRAGLHSPSIYLHTNHGDVCAHFVSDDPDPIGANNVSAERAGHQRLVSGITVDGELFGGSYDTLTGSGVIYMVAAS